MGYTQTHTIEDIRLVLGYASIIVAGITAYFDMYIGFVEMQNSIAVGVVVYFILAGLYNGCLYFYERGLIYTGKKNSLSIAVRSSTQKASPDYNLSVKTTDNSGKVIVDKTVVTQFNELFDYRGFLVYSKLQNWLDSQLAETKEDKKSQ